jgi:hypothetical protein
LRGVLRDDRADAQRRFRAALALADYVPESDAASWTARDLTFMAEQLVSFNAEYQPLLRGALRPMRARLLGDLERQARATRRADARRERGGSSRPDMRRAHG